MITPADIRKKAERKYYEVLRALVSGEAVFPWIVPANKTLPKNLAAHREALNSLLQASKAHQNHGYTVELETRQTRQLGTQSVPREIRFDTAEDYLAWLGKTKEATHYQIRVAELTTFDDRLREWALQYPKKVMDQEADWPQVLSVLTWFVEAYQPDQYYVRELPVAVHTKFVEQHQGLLEELLVLLVPQHHRPEGNTFPSRWGLRDKEYYFRLRALAKDGTIQGFSELALPLSALRELSLPVEKVYILENEITYLTFPAQPEAIAIFGSGKAVSRLREVGWLAGVDLYYWSDLDAEGFEMLNDLRQVFPLLHSLFMDEATWTEHQAWGGQGSGAREKLLGHLTPIELALYQMLVRDNLRLEQERIPVTYQKATLS